PPGNCRACSGRARPRPRAFSPDGPRRGSPTGAATRAPKRGSPEWGASRANPTGTSAPGRPPPARGAWVGRPRPAKRPPPAPGPARPLMRGAVAGGAAVPFFSVAGSSFVGLFVGVGAARVGDLFSEARKRAPAIIFIDELDAIGQRRAGSGAVVSNDEREQTL